MSDNEIPEIRTIYGHFPLFLVVASFNILDVCGLAVLLSYLILYQFKKAQRVKHIYKLLIGGTIIDLVANVFILFRSIVGRSLVVILPFQMISLILVITQILFILLGLLQIQKMFAVLDPWLERMARPSQIILLSLTATTTLIIIVLFTARLFLKSLQSFMAYINISSFLLFASVSATIGIYSVYLIRTRLKELYTKTKKQHNNEKNQKVMRTINQLQYLILVAVLILGLLIIVIISIYVIGVDHLDEIVAVTMVFLSIIRSVFYLFFELCKSVVLVKKESNFYTTDQQNAPKEHILLIKNEIRTDDQFQDKKTILLVTSETPSF